MKFTLWNVIGAGLSFAFGGFIGLGIFITGLLIFWYHMTCKGALFIQSYLFLMLRKDGLGALEASIGANNCSVDEMRYLNDGALNFADIHSGGKQLPVIHAAREEGYVHRRKSVLEYFRYIMG